MDQIYLEREKESEGSLANYINGIVDLSHSLYMYMVADTLQNGEIKCKDVKSSAISPSIVIDQIKEIGEGRVRTPTMVDDEINWIPCICIARMRSLMLYPSK